MSSFPYHDGPPFPFLVDEPTAAGECSVWADPDVGVGTFYLYMDEGWNRQGTSVLVAVRPVDGRLPEATYTVEPAREGEPFQLVGQVDFDERGPWDVRFLVDGPDGHTELAKTIDVTPPGLGAFGVVGFLLPFLAIAFLWGAVLVKKRSLRVRQPASDSVLG